MIRLPILAATALAAATLAPAAHAVDLVQTVDIAAPPDKVWAIVADFDSISKWHPAAKSSPATKGNMKGSVRVITLNAPGDPTITEKLVAYDASAHFYRYDIVKVNPKVLPVIHYHSTFTVTPAGNGSQLVWSGTFDHAAGSTDADAVKAITGVYRGGLDNIKVLAEK